MQSQIQKKSIGIIGGGLSGITAGRLLGSQQFKNHWDLSIFEKAHHISGGRSCSRINEGVLENGQNYKLVCDYGANYLSFQSEEQKNFLYKNLFDHIPEIKPFFKLIDKPIYVLHTEDNTIEKSDFQGDKWTFPDGLKFMAQQISKENLENKNIYVEHGVNRIEQLNQDKKWRVYFDNQQQQDFDFLIFGQTPTSLLKIFNNSLQHQPGNKIIQDYVNSLEEFKYRKILSIFMSFKIDSEVEIDTQKIYDFFALLNLDRKHPISWLSFENDKPGHVNGNLIGATIQMSNEWSLQNWEKDQKEIEQMVLNEVRNVFSKEENKKFFGNNLELNLLGKENLECFFSLMKKWNYALHDNQAKNMDVFTKNQLQNGIYFCGDFLYPKARVANALESGVLTSQQIIKDLLENNNAQQKL